MLRCADLPTALGALKARPGEPTELIDARGTRVQTMFVHEGFELKTMYGGLILCTEAETRDFLVFLQAPISLEPLSAEKYFVGMR